MMDHETICPYCKGRVADGAEFCSQCGVCLLTKGRTGAWIEAIPFKPIFAVAAVCVSIFMGFVLVSWFNRPLTYDARRPTCKNNLKQIAQALHTYHDAYNCFPPAFVADKDGKPMHSWRVLILPYIDEKPLYASYDFTKPWDAPENRHVLEQMPELFRCPYDTAAADDTTSYAGVYGPGCVFDPSGPVRIRDIKDGTTNTLMVGEVIGGAIPWTKPEDIDVSQHPGINQSGGFGCEHTGAEGGCFFALADGSTRFVTDETDSETLNGLFHRNDGNSVDAHQK